MENIPMLLLCVLLAWVGIQLVLMPVRLLWHLGIQGIGGVLCLLVWQLPVNAVTLALSAFLGLPGVALVGVLHYI